MDSNVLNVYDMVDRYAPNMRCLKILADLCSLPTIIPIQIQQYGKQYKYVICHSASCLDA